jgi:hypothetical protein
MQFDIYQSSSKRVLVNDHFIIFGKDHCVSLENTVLIRITGKESKGYILLGQYAPSRYYASKNFKTKNEVIDFLESNSKVQVIDKKLANASGGELRFQDDSKLYFTGKSRWETTYPNSMEFSPPKQWGFTLVDIEEAYLKTDMIAEYEPKRDMEIIMFQEGN